MPPDTPGAESTRGNRETRALNTVPHHRFVVDAGPGISLRSPSFDHIIRGNVLAVGRANQPGISLSGGACPGIEVLDNRLYGGDGRMVAGETAQVARGNEIYSRDPNPPKPQPQVPSIFAWQRGPGE